jgi:predicted O-methyltransferase YrrM
MKDIDDIRARVRRIAHWIDVDLELPLFYEHVGALSPGDVYLEVGTGITASSAIIAALSSHLGVEVHTIDDGSMWADRGIDEGSFREKVEGYLAHYDVMDRVTFHIAKSEDLAWDKPINVLFIDGAHDYANVSTDIGKWAPFVPAGGIILFHDCLSHKGVMQAVNEVIRSSASWEELESGGSICIFRRM